MWRKSEGVAVTQMAIRSSSEKTSATSRSQVWTMFIKRVYEVAPLCCPDCGGQTKVVSFIERPQPDAIDAILTHCSVRQSRSAIR